VKKYLKALLHNFIFSYGLAVLIYLALAFSKGSYSILLTKEYLLFLVILLFTISAGSTFAFQPELRHINIWLRRLVLTVYTAILCDIGVYIFPRYVYKLSKNMTATLIGVPIILFIVSFVIYFIADKIEARKIEKMNESLRQYNDNGGDGV